MIRVYNTCIVARRLWWKNNAAGVLSTLRNTSSPAPSVSIIVGATFLVRTQSVSVHNKPMHHKV